MLHSWCVAYSHIQNLTAATVSGVVKMSCLVITCLRGLTTFAAAAAVVVVVVAVHGLGAAGAGARVSLDRDRRSRLRCSGSRGGGV